LSNTSYYTLCWECSIIYPNECLDQVKVSNGKWLHLKSTGSLTFHSSSFVLYQWFSTLQVSFFPKFQIRETNVISILLSCNSHYDWGAAKKEADRVERSSGCSWGWKLLGSWHGSTCCCSYQSQIVAWSSQSKHPIAGQLLLWNCLYIT